MIDKFIRKFKEFAENENLGGLSDEGKVSLFGVYLNVMRPTAQPSVPEVPMKAANRIRKPNRPATTKQMEFIQKLMRQGKLDDDINTNRLTVGEASALIDAGIKSKGRVKPALAPDPEVEEEPEGDYTGSYSHSSGGATSTETFWE